MIKCLSLLHPRLSDTSMGAISEGG